MIKKCIIYYDELIIILKCWCFIYLLLQVNCVLMRKVNFDELCNFVELTRDRAIDYRFIEFMPFTKNDWNKKQLVPYKEAIQEIIKSYPNFEPCDSSPNSTSKVKTIL